MAQDAPDSLHGEGGSPALFGGSRRVGWFVRTDRRGERVLRLQRVLSGGREAGD